MVNFRIPVVIPVVLVALVAAPAAAQPAPIRVPVPNQMGASISEHADHAAAGHDTDSPRANGFLVVIDAATGTVRCATEVGPYAAALGLSGGN